MEAKATYNSSTHNNYYSSSSMKDKLVKKGSMEEDDDDDDLLTAATHHEDNEKKKRSSSTSSVGGSGKKGSSNGGGGGGVSSMRCCQAENCSADLTDTKQYYKRHKVCELHAKAQVVVVGGLRQRFCQQCSRFHELLEFDEAKRSCRRRLAGHNERRRKNPADHQSHGEASGRKGVAGGNQLKSEIVCGQVDERARIQIGIQENGSFKHFQIR